MNNPLVRVRNQSSIALFIEGDPNWDDQELLVNGAPIGESFVLAQNAEATVSVQWEARPDEYMMGVIFADGPNFDGDDAFYQLTIGQREEDGALDVIDGDEPETGGAHKTRYLVSERKALSMTMTFTSV